MERPLRYWPVGTDFVITNGTEYFNRPLYGGRSSFRVDGGDVPEFSLYLPGRGGNLRLGIRTATGVKWLHDSHQIVSRYRPGMMIYEIRDPQLGTGEIRLAAVALRAEEGLILRAEFSGDTDAELIFAFGGVNGMRGRRNGDIGCEIEPVSRFFQLRSDQCASNRIELAQNTFVVVGKPGGIGGITSAGTKLAVADAKQWNQPAKLFNDPNADTLTPVVIGSLKLETENPKFIALRKLTGSTNAEEVLAIYRAKAADSGFLANPRAAKPWRVEDLPTLFADEVAARCALAGRVAVKTPDPFVNAAVGALNIAADAVWDERADVFLHGGVAWRVRLLGWRAGYTGDALGWHDRTAGHFESFADQQNTNQIPAAIPAPENSANLSRNETALHSNGDLTGSHYDMNLVGVDTFFRHLLWTGDLEYARKLWPVIERHLAWERRLFRREFGPAKLPLYEAYCCIWASDDLAYNGGGATHSTAYNLFHNRMAARVAKWLGKDPAPYESEADLIQSGLKENLWLADRGWFAEWKDLLGRQLVHPNAAVWTFYHALDSEVPTPMEAWQMTRFVDTQIPHFPLDGSGVPGGNHTIATTSWMPYAWSLNNVVMAETMHTSLGYWQANRADGAFALFKGALLDSMYCGLCPGNLGMCTWFDANRGESQRDFGDGIGAASRAVIEGLFGVKPDLIAGQVKFIPGFPPEWNYADLRHPDFNFSFQRAAQREIYKLEQRWPKLARWILQIPALREDIAGVRVNGKSADWQIVPDAVGKPRVEITADSAAEQIIEIEWRGNPVAAHQQIKTSALASNAIFSIHFNQGKLTAVADPQRALSRLTVAKNGFEGRATGAIGQRTVFAKLSQGAMSWWQPVTFEILPETGHQAVFDWMKPVVGELETMDLSAQFNDRVTQIFRNEYLAPRSPFCSLAKPKQGFGSWCHPADSFVVNDSGLRALAAKNGGKILLPNGVPLVTPGEAGTKNIAFVSQWDSYPPEISVPLHGKASRAFLLMAGSTDAMQSRFENGEIVVTYTDGSSGRLALENPTTWWPIDQDYYLDDFAFRQNNGSEPLVLPPRVDLATGRIRVLNPELFKQRGGKIPGGAATVLTLPLDPSKELKSLTLRAIANEVVIGLMGVTLHRR